MRYRTVSDGHHALSWVAGVTGSTAAIGGLVCLLDPTGVHLGVDGMYMSAGIPNLMPVALFSLVLSLACGIVTFGVRRNWPGMWALGVLIGAALLTAVAVQSLKIGFGYPPQVFIAVLGGTIVILSGLVLASQLRSRRRHREVTTVGPIPQGTDPTKSAQTLS